MGVPGWLSWLSTPLRLRSWPPGTWVWAPYRAFCCQHRACFRSSLPLSLCHSPVLSLKNNKYFKKVTIRITCLHYLIFISCWLLWHPVANESSKNREYFYLLLERRTSNKLFLKTHKRKETQEYEENKDRFMAICKMLLLIINPESFVDIRPTAPSSRRASLGRLALLELPRRGF